MGEERKKMRETVKFSFLFPLTDYMALKLNNNKECIPSMQGRKRKNKHFQ